MDDDGVAIASSLLAVVVRLVRRYCFLSQLDSLGWSVLMGSISESRSILASVVCLEWAVDKPWADPLPGCPVWALFVTFWAACFARSTFTVGPSMIARIRPHVVATGAASLSPMESPRFGLGP